jgi:hypothetical protein
MDSPNAPQHNDIRHISSMKNRSDFNREKISCLRLAREKARVDRSEYGEKDTCGGKLLKTIAAHREY